MYRGIKQDAVAALGEFVGTTMFIFLGLGCVKTAQDSQTAGQLETQTTLSNQTVFFISTGMGLSLLITAWVFYRITGGLFNPAVTFALWLIGGIKAVRAILLTCAQFAGGIAGAALVSGLTPLGSIGSAVTTLQPGMSYVQGTFLEAFLTSMLVFTVLMLAAEKHKATYLAPVGIGLTLFVGQLFGTLWTGCGMNPARSLGPSAVSGKFPAYHWLYYVGPYLGAVFATALYTLLKAFDYTSVVLGQDSAEEDESPAMAQVYRKWSNGDRVRRLSGSSSRSNTHRDELSKAETGRFASRDNRGSGDSNMTESTLAPLQPPATVHGKALRQAGPNYNQTVGKTALPPTHAMQGIADPGAQSSGLTKLPKMQNLYKSSGGPK